MFQLPKSDLDGALEQKFRGPSLGKKKEVVSDYGPLFPNCCVKHEWLDGD